MGMGTGWIGTNRIVSVCRDHESDCRRCVVVVGVCSSSDVLVIVSAERRSTGG